MATTNHAFKLTDSTRQSRNHGRFKTCCRQKGAGGGPFGGGCLSSCSRIVSGAGTVCGRARLGGAASSPKKLESAECSSSSGKALLGLARGPVRCGSQTGPPAAPKTDGKSRTSPEPCGQTFNPNRKMLLLKTARALASVFSDGDVRPGPLGGAGLMGKVPDVVCGLVISGGLPSAAFGRGITLVAVASVTTLRAM